MTPNRHVETFFQAGDAFIVTSLVGAATPVGAFQIMFGLITSPFLRRLPSLKERGACFGSATHSVRWSA